MQDGMNTWEGLGDYYKDLNSRIPTYVGDTKEEYEALVKLGDMGFLWGTQCHGPCEGGAIGPMVRMEGANGALPFYHPSDSGWTMACEDADRELVCVEHNRAMVKLYLSLHSSRDSE